ncbi:MAG TPA: acyl-CoA carboxylase epsilon subunit [Propionibacteriaceae bacterium]
MSLEPNDPIASPLLEVVRGHPDEAELAAVLAVLLAGSGQSPAEEAAGAAGAAAPAPGSGWSAYWRAVRAPLAPGPGAWRASGRT